MKSKPHTTMEKAFLEGFFYGFLTEHHSACVTSQFCELCDLVSTGYSIVKIKEKQMKSKK